MIVKKILGITVLPQTKKNILEKIIKYTEKPDGFYHIVSINPENLVIAQSNAIFKKVVETAQMKIIDGVGIVLAARLLNIEIGERLTGVDLMSELIRQANRSCFRVLLIGGDGNLAVTLADCYQRKFPEAKILGLSGIKNIRQPKKEEEAEIFSIVLDYKPHLIFVAFGSPYQELWLWEHQDHFQNCVVMGGGGAFDYLSGRISRAPELVRSFGFEWTYRLVRQPWRLRRQLRLIVFLWLIIKQKITDFWKKVS